MDLNSHPFGEWEFRSLISQYGAIKHIASQQVQDRREDALQRLRIDGVRHLGAERGGEDAHDRDGKERGKMNVAERVGEAGKRGFRPTAHDVADRAREGDREAERRRGADGLVHRNVAVSEEGNRDEAAARTDEGRDGPDAGARSDHAGRAGKAAGSLHFLREEHLRRGVAHEAREDERYP